MVNKKEEDQNKTWHKIESSELYPSENNPDNVVLRIKFSHGTHKEIEMSLPAADFAEIFGKHVRRAQRIVNLQKGQRRRPSPSSG